MFCSKTEREKKVVVQIWSWHLLKNELSISIYLFIFAELNVYRWKDEINFTFVFIVVIFDHKQYKSD